MITTLAAILQQLPSGATLTDQNNESFLVVDIDTAEDTNDYILDGNEIVLMRNGYRAEVVYRVTEE